jgi:hypothetical protein
VFDKKRALRSITKRRASLWDGGKHCIIRFVVVCGSNNGRDRSPDGAARLQVWGQNTTAARPRRLHYWNSELNCNKETCHDSEALLNFSSWSCVKPRARIGAGVVDPRHQHGQQGTRLWTQHSFSNIQDLKHVRKYPRFLLPATQDINLEISSF